jgi:hypothetical protein
MTAAEKFELVQREAKALTKSGLVPKEYRGDSPESMANCMVALDIARRINMPPLMVMQNLYVIQGRPSWASSFIIAALNSSGKFSPIRYRMTQNPLSCTAVATDLSTGNELEGPTITMEMAREEGWLTKTGSKWKTMPELMIRYRAAAFFGRLYAPEILCGLHLAEEVEDIQRREPTVAASIEDRLAPKPEAEDAELVEGELPLDPPAE